MKVCLDAGHGGSDSGARSVVDGYFESTCVLDVALKSRALLLPHLDVHMTRETDEFVSLSQRARMANEWGVDIFVSLHCNSASTDGKGFEVFSSRGYTRSDELVIKLANRHIEAFPNQTNRGIKEANFYVLKHTAMPAALLEFGFLSNREEAAWLSSESVRQEIAQAMSLGILDYFGIKADSPVTLEDRIAKIEKHLGI